MASPQLPSISNPDFDLVSTIYPFTVKDLDGRPVKLEKYKGNICLITNVTSESKGYSEHNYKLLIRLHEKFAESEGLRILAFPCNQFNNEEPGTNQDIKKFVTSQGVKFDVFGKTNVNCAHAHPLWKFLKLAMKNNPGPLLPKQCRFNKCSRSVITEPFTKFIINRAGEPVSRLGSEMDENDILNALEPHFNGEAYRLKREALAAKLEASLKPILLPPPLKADDRPCKKTWYFTKGKIEQI